MIDVEEPRRSIGEQAIDDVVVEQPDETPVDRAEGSDEPDGVRDCCHGRFLGGFLHESAP